MSMKAMTEKTMLHDQHLVFLLFAHFYNFTFRQSLALNSSVLPFMIMQHLPSFTSTWTCDWTVLDDAAAMFILPVAKYER